MKQLALFDQTAGAAATTDGRRGHTRPDHDSDHLLATFQAARTAEGAHPRTVKREMSQLPSLVREASAVDPTQTLRTLLADIELLARLLREPVTTTSRATGRSRLLAVQRFLRILAQSHGRDPVRDLVALDARLPARRPTGWHTTGALVAGAPGRRRRRGPTLDAADLRRIIDAAGAGGAPTSLFATVPWSPSTASRACALRRSSVSVGRISRPN
jgi:hypothetical protein